MRFSRLLELLQTFSSSERTQFRLFVASPYFVQGKKNGQLTALLAFGLGSLDRPPETWPDNTAAYAALFPGAPRVAGKLGKWTKTLHRLAMQFIIVEQVRKPENEPENQIKLTAELQRRRLFDRSEALLCTTRKLLDNLERGQVKDHLLRFKLIEHEMNQMVLHPSKKVRFAPNEAFETVYLQYQAMKLDLAIATKSLHHRISFAPSTLAQYMLYEEPFFEELAQDHPLLYLSSRFVSITSQDRPNLEQFGQYVRSIREYENLLLPADVKRVWAMARNILLHWWLKNKDLEIVRLYFDLALDNLSNGRLHYHGLILHQTLESVCAVGLELNEHAVVYRLLQEHRGRIAGEQEDEPFFRYNLARYHFYIGNFREALDMLPHALPDPSYYIGAKILEIQILYELQSELLPFRMDAFRLFLRRGAIQIGSPERIESIRLFLNALARICRCPQGNTSRADTILTQIRATPHITVYYWLIKKAEQKGASNV
jgi:hypothetical protein